MRGMNRFNRIGKPGGPDKPLPGAVTVRIKADLRQMCEESSRRRAWPHALCGWAATSDLLMADGRLGLQRDKAVALGVMCGVCEPVAS